MMFHWLVNASLDKVVAHLSEGYCPNCKGRLTSQVPFDLEDHDSDETLGVRDGLFAQGSEPGRDWFSAQMLHPKGLGLVTMALNPRSEEEEEW